LPQGRAPGLTAIIRQEQSSNGEKNDPAFFIFPCWIEVANSLRTGLNSIIDHQEKIPPIERVWRKIEALLCNNIA
jgi:hypothetical protein